MNYGEFLDSKLHHGSSQGFEPVFMPKEMFDFQTFLTTWGVRTGRCAEFTDCGTGKTLMELVWLENMVRKCGKRALLLTPCAVAAQTVREGEKFNIGCTRSRDGKLAGEGIIVTNYEKLHLFKPDDFCAVACDESSILKSFDGARKLEITNFMRKVQYRSLWTATAAPNDYIELGTSSEALGYLGYMDMLNMFFKNDQNNSALRRQYGEAPKWRFKGHSELPFWRWVSSWARAMRKPSDYGFSDGAFVLPPLQEHEHIIKARKLRDGFLFDLPAVGLDEQREERRRTIPERCAKVAELVSDKRQALVWCHMNEEGDLLEELIKDCVQVAGSDSDEAKEEKFLAFSSGQARVLVTKPKIGAWGLNFQNCAHIVGFPSHSYEQDYQGVRRCWRFGQTKPVDVDRVLTEGEIAVLKNLKRKAAQADRMFTRLVETMNDALKVSRATKFETQEKVPSWLAPISILPTSTRSTMATALR